jgi:hypothetical protein
MPISDRTRKLLWGKSGNRCAKCFRVLTVEETELDDPSIVGEECHIVSGRDGPRSDAGFPPEEIDDYPNLILLCRIDHKTVDDQEHTFDALVLRTMKEAHERKVARALALAPTLLDDDDSDPGDLLDRYTKAFRAFHAVELHGMVATPILYDGSSASTTDLLRARFDGHLVVAGLSGSGKSYLLRHMANRAFDDGVIPIFARASVYGGDIEQLLDRAVAPFDNASYDSVRRAAARTGKRLAIIVDAFNEAPPALRGQLRESLAALARKTDHMLWASSTEDPRLSSVGPHTVHLTSLTDADRTALFAFYAPRVVVEPSVLAAFATPFEVVIAAETVRGNEGRVSAYELLHRFAANRLKHAERPAHAHALLERVAHEMSRTYRATVSRRTLMRLAEETPSPNPSGDVDTLIRSGILREFGSDITFMHEQVQIFYEALSFLGGRGVAMMARIATPDARRLAPYVLSGLEDAEEIRACAAALGDSHMFASMLGGTHGARAHAIAREDALTLLAECERAIGDAEISIHRDARPYTLLPARASFENLPALDPSAFALLAAVGEATRDGAFLEETIALLEATEARVYAGMEPRDRTSLFADLFVLHGDRRLCAASVLIHAATAGFVRVSEGALRLIPLLEPLSDTADAVLYLACSLLQHSDIAAADAIRIFRETWRRGIYHLSLEALDLLQFRRSSVTDEEAADIRLVLEECPTNNVMLNTAVTDVMLSYDMLESPVSETTAAEEFAALLAMPDSDDAFTLAYGLISNCFEDIFQGAYWQAMRDLSPEAEVLVLTRAALGTDPSGFHAEWILHRLVKLGDARALPAYLRWATADPAESSFPQSATVSFFASVAACAVLGAPFTAFAAPSRNHEAWKVLGEIVYVMNGGAPTTATSELWRQLIEIYPSDAVEPLKDLAQKVRDFDGVDLDVAARFPQEFARLLDQVVRRGLAVTSIRDHAPWLEQDAPTFVFGKLAIIGNAETVALLRPLASHPRFGIDVVNTMRAIQSR